MKPKVLFYETSPLYRSIYEIAFEGCSKINIIAISGSKEEITKILNEDSIDILVTRYTNSEDTNYPHFLLEKIPSLKLLGLIQPDYDDKNRTPLKISYNSFFCKYNATENDIVDTILNIQAEAPMKDVNELLNEMYNV